MKDLQGEEDYEDHLPYDACLLKDGPFECGNNKGFKASAAKDCILNQKAYIRFEPVSSMSILVVVHDLMVREIGMVS